MPTSSAPELELSLISFAGSGSTATWQGGDKSKRRWREGWGWAIIGGRRLFQTFRSKDAIIRRTAFIRGLFCFGVMVEYDNLVTFELASGLYSWWGKIELARRSVLVLLLFVGMIGRVKRWMSLIAWNLSLKLETMSLCRHDDLV